MNRRQDCSGALAWIVLGALVAVTGCSTYKPGTYETRKGDEIMVAGQLVHTGTRVVLWLDPGGYDAYRVERRFSPIEKSGWDDSAAEVKGLTSPNRYGLRRGGLTEDEVERLRGGGWDLKTLQRVVDQFVIHYDACGTSRQCFKVLHDMRDLSVHFLLDLDGTIYQTLDLKERAWHATSSNTRSVGIEIANIGAYDRREGTPLEDWYVEEGNGHTRIRIPEKFGDGGLRTKDFTGRPARAECVHGRIQDTELAQYDFTPEQYRALIRLTATLVRVFPRIRCDDPRDAEGKLVLRKLSDAELRDYQGVLGHFHIQTEKVDPGPAFQWDYVIEKARRLASGGADTSLGHMRER